MTPNFERRWENKHSAARAAADKPRTSYYGIAPIHKPHWKWLIIVYFFFGGIAGMSYVIASIAQLWGGSDTQRITRVGRYVSLAALLPSPILLIWDLGRPERFHHMLRVLKLRSPMSVGTWVLTTFGAFCGVSALIQAGEDGLLRRVPLVAHLLHALPSKPIAALGAVFGFAVSGYTGLLVAITAVPFWAKNYLLLGPLFLASALTNATSAITLVLTLGRGTNHQTLKRLERLELVAVTAEFALLLAARFNLGPIIARPLREGHLGRVWRYLVLGTGISAPMLLLALSNGLAHQRVRHVITPLAALLSLIGGQSFRYLIVMAGRESADDPQATWAFTRKP